MSFSESFTFILVNSESTLPENMFFRSIVILLLNLTSYSYLALKFYKLMCYSKLTFEWLPMVNPYVWPFSTFQVLTGSYFKFWAKIFPPIKFEKSSIEISSIIALEAINSILYFLVKFSNILILYLTQTETATENLF